VINLLRVILIGDLIFYLYPETFDFIRNFQNHDYLLAHWDQRMFGFQPAFIFAQLFTGRWIEELMYMGYFFFYMLIIGSVLFIYFKNRPHFEYFLFTVLFSFFVYYLIYILFPTAGPQFYYSAIGPADVKTGLFPHIGCYFNYNSVSSDVNSVHGFFPLLVERIQCFGERPTAAFPSSHVGISTLILLLLFKDRQYRYFLVLFPVYLILVLATVYIRAHYVVDVLSGFFSAIVLFFISPYVYSIFVKPTSLLKIK
jgi:membrane-associated phospholipid phosphatase